MDRREANTVARLLTDRRVLTLAGSAGLVLIAAFLASRYHSLLLAAAAGLLVGWLAIQLRRYRAVDWTAQFAVALRAAGGGSQYALMAQDPSTPSHLVQAYNTMLGALNARQVDLDTRDRQMTVTASGLTAQIRQALAQALGDAQAIESAVTELTGAVEEVASSSAQAAASSRQANKGADEGKLVMTEALGSMDLLSGELSNARQAMQQLDAHIESIGGVLDVIRGIAEQTNMLALNAAIEAARAGDQGRGFAVVADEVRNLAGRTQHSTQEIQAMIERVQSGARKVVEVVVEGDNQAKVCEEQIETACVSLAEMSGEITAINSLTAQIDQLATRQHEVVTRLGRQMSEAAESRQRALENCGLDEVAEEEREA